MASVDVGDLAWKAGVAISEQKISVEDNRETCLLLKRQLTFVRSKFKMLQDRIDEKRRSLLVGSLVDSNVKEQFDEVQKMLSDISSNVADAGEKLEKCWSKSYNDSWLQAFFRGTKTKRELEALGRSIDWLFKWIDGVEAEFNKKLDELSQGRQSSLDLKSLVASLVKEEVGKFQAGLEKLQSSAEEALVVPDERLLRLCSAEIPTYLKDAWRTFRFSGIDEKTSALLERFHPSKSFFFELENFPEAKAMDVILSENVEAGGLSWALLVDIEERDGGARYLSLFLYVADEEALQSGLKFRASFQLVVVNQSDTSKSILRGKKHEELDSSDPACSFKYVVAIGDLELEGFLNNGALRILLSIAHEGTRREEDIHWI